MMSEKSIRIQAVVNQVEETQLPSRKEGNDDFDVDATRIC